MSNENEGFARWLLRQSLFMTLATMLVMLILRPFGVISVSVDYALYVAGVSLLVAFSFAVVALVSRCLIGWRTDCYWLSTLVHLPFLILLMSVLLTCYEGALYSGGPLEVWVDADGNLSLTHWGLDILYVAAMAIVVGGFSVFFEYNRRLRIGLREAMEMNAALARHASASPSVPSPSSSVNLEGTSRENLQLPSADDILYAESDANYVHVYYIADGSVHRKTLRATLKSVEEQLTPFDALLRCHRAFIVNTHRVESVSGNSQGYRLRMQLSGAEVPVSRQYSTVVYERINS